MLLVVVGIVLHIVATSRRKRVDQELPVPYPCGRCRASGEGEMSFNIGSQNGGVINNVGGDQRIAGGQHGNVVVGHEQARRAARDLRVGLTRTPLGQTEAAQAHARVDEVDTEMRSPKPDRSRIARADRATRHCRAPVDSRRGPGGPAAHARQLAGGTWGASASSAPGARLSRTEWSADSVEPPEPNPKILNRLRTRASRKTRPVESPVQEATRDSLMTVHASVVGTPRYWPYRWTATRSAVVSRRFMARRSDVSITASPLPSRCRQCPARVPSTRMVCR